MKMSQEPFYADIYRQKAADQDRAPRFVQTCAIEMHMDISQEPLYMESGNLQEKCPSPELGRRLCASRRSRNAFGQFTRATLHRNLAKKCPSSEPRLRLCARLRSRNALGDFTRATLYGNLQAKGRRPAGAP